MKIAVKAKAAAMIACLFASAISAQTVLYSENFTLPDGTTQGLGTPPNWTLSGNPIFWDHFEVRSNQMEANKISIEGAWISKTFDITGFTDVTLSVDLSSAGSLSSGDYIRGFYKLNGGSEVQWFSITGSTAPVTKTFNGISGGSLQVVIRMRNDNGETWFFDNVTVTGNCATNAGTASVSQTVISSGQTVDLALSGHSGTIQWQQSTDNITFTDIAGGTTTPFTTAQLTGPGVFYFRAKVTNVCAGFSNVVSVTVNEATATFTTDSLHVNEFITVGNTIVIDGTVDPAPNHIYTKVSSTPPPNPFDNNLFVQNAGKSVLHTIFGNRVGIGPLTQNPAQRLHLKEITNSQTNGQHLAIRLELRDDAPGGGTFTWDIINGGSLFFSRTGTSTGAAFSINTNDQVQIGPQRPFSGMHTDYLLSVDGKIVAKEVVVTPVGWADYVNLPCYRLLPMDSIRPHIRKYGYLWGMPSGKEVEKNGQNLSELQRLQQVKIEEYALYIAELHERLKVLERNNAEMRKQKRWERKKKLKELERSNAELRKHLAEISGK